MSAASESASSRLLLGNYKQIFLLSMENTHDNALYYIGGFIVIVYSKIVDDVDVGDGK